MEQKKLTSIILEISNTRVRTDQLIRIRKEDLGHSQADFGKYDTQIENNLNDLKDLRKRLLQIERMIEE